MSWGLICACADPDHPFEERSIAGALGITSRCRRYAEDQESGGLCPECKSARHVAAEPGDRDHNQRAYS